jgi:hypothetical protein
VNERVLKNVKVRAICLAAMLLPVIGVIGANLDKIVKEDKKKGTLLYFKASG